MMEKSDELLTAREVAAICRWRTTTVYLKACKGKIPSVKVGGSLRFRRKDIEAMIQNRPAEKTDESDVSPQVDLTS